MRLPHKKAVAMYTTQGYGQNISSVLAAVVPVVVCKICKCGNILCRSKAVKMQLEASGADFPNEALIGGLSNCTGLG
jgi:SH3-like domain-containing protein